MSELSLTAENVEAIKVLIKDTMESYERSLEIEGGLKWFPLTELNDYLENELGYDFSSYYEGLTDEEGIIYDDLADYRDDMFEIVFKYYQLRSYLSEDREFEYNLYK